MPLNLTEAEAVNKLIQHLTGQDPHPLRVRRPFTQTHTIPDRARAIDALVELAGAAYKRLSAGIRPDTARAALEAHWPGALHEVWMLQMHGADAEPYVSEQTARHHALTEGGWDPDTDLAWRESDPDENGRVGRLLYANGTYTLCATWPATIRGIAGVPADALDAPDESVARCKVCGCTEDDPCDRGCAWATGSSLEIDLCTACAWTIARDAVESGIYKPTLIDAPIFNGYGLALPYAEHLPWSRLVAFQDFCAAVWGECDRPWAKWGEQHHPDGTGGKLSRSIRDQARALTQRSAAAGTVTWENILAEEVYEAFAEDAIQPLRTELIQSTAVIATWLSDIDKRRARPASTTPTTPDTEPAPVDEQPATPSQLIWDLACEWTRGRGTTGVAPHVIRLYDGPELFDPDRTGRFVEIAHPAECRTLPPGARCWIDTAPHREWWPGQTGIYRIHPEDVVDGGDEDGPNIVPGWVCHRYDETTRTWNDYQEPDAQEQPA